MQNTMAIFISICIKTQFVWIFVRVHKWSTFILSLCIFKTWKLLLVLHAHHHSFARSSKQEQQKMNERKNGSKFRIEIETICKCTASLSSPKTESCPKWIVSTKRVHLFVSNFISQHIGNFFFSCCSWFKPKIISIWSINRLYFGYFVYLCFLSSIR